MSAQQPSKYSDWCVVTVGERHAAILREVLRDELANADAQIVSAGSKSAAEALARSILAVRGRPTILVLDAEQMDEDAIEREREVLVSSLGSASPGIPFDVCLASPTIEECLFADSALIERQFQTNLTADQVARANRQPHVVLDELFRRKGQSNSAEDVRCLLAGEDLTRVRKHPLVVRVARAFRKSAR